jgi:hypothetical protein
VRVVDEAGTPVAGALVSVAWSNIPYPEISLVTDPSGEVRLPLSEGRFRIVAHAPDGRHGSLEAAVDDGAPRATWRLVLSRSK